MKLNKYIACICEGAAEQAIMELLLDSGKLIFDSSNLLEDEIIRSRSARQFEERYLRKDFKEKITVLRILDSRKENFKLSKAYLDKVEIIDIITAPEIEMLIIHSEGKYEEFKKTKKKPSDFCKVNLRLKDVKKYSFVREYFSNVDKLLRSIAEHKQKSQKREGENMLFDLLK